MMMMERFVRLFRNSADEGAQPLSECAGWWPATFGAVTSPDAALKLSAVYRAVDDISNSIAKMPFFVMDSRRRQRLDEHALLCLLTFRPNDNMSAFDFKKLMIWNKLLSGNGYAWIERDAMSLRPIGLYPLHPDCVTVKQDTNGTLWYYIYFPHNGRHYVVSALDILHLKGPSFNGLVGVSVLTFASEVIGVARAQQGHEASFYRNNAQPTGVLQTEGDLSPEKKEVIRSSWEYLQGGDNAFRTAVLDMGLKYTPVSLSNKDSQFVESKAVSVEDISRYFGIPLFKLNAGSQSYSSNEQNSIEYVNGTLIPAVIQVEQEFSFKLFALSEQAHGLQIKLNHMAELRGDMASRAAWYKIMREIGAYSVNDVLDFEDMPSVEGGEARLASLNYVPLADFERLSTARNETNG